MCEKMLLRALILFTFLLKGVCYSQYYTPAQLQTIHSNKTAYEGDMYLDTINKKYYEGLTNGELARIGDTLDELIDSLKVISDTLFIYEGKKSLKVLLPSGDTTGGGGSGDEDSTNELIDSVNVVNDSIFIHQNSTTFIAPITANYYTGWADYSDNQYTSASPLVVTTKVTLPNNAGNTVDFQKPIDVTTFYNSTDSTITGRNGDGINITIEFRARPNLNDAPRITVAIDIGGAVGEIYPRDFVLSKGTGIEHFYLSSFTGYTLNTWEANGGKVKIVSTSSVDIYDIRYVITRTHKAR